MYRGTYTKKQILTFTYCLTVGLLIALVWGGYDLVTGESPVLQLHGIGVVTRSSLYVSIMTILFMGLALDDTIRTNKNSGHLFYACYLLTVPFLFIMACRGTLLGTALTILIISLLFFKNRNYITLIILSAISITILLFIVFHFFSATSISERIKHISSSKIDFDNLSIDLYTSDKIRYECWMIAFAQATQSDKKLLGIGPGNFKGIDITKLKYKKPPAHTYIFQVKLRHAHNIYLNKWVEEGILGLAVFLLFQFYIVYQFIKNRPKNNTIQWEWVAGAGAFIIPTIAGQFNTGLYGTNAWLIMLFTGYALGRFRGMEEQTTLQTTV